MAVAGHPDQGMGVVTVVNQVVVDGVTLSAGVKGQSDGDGHFIFLGQSTSAKVDNVRIGATKFAAALGDADVTADAAGTAAINA